MCGILGLVDKNQLISSEKFDNSLKLLNHRGPDNKSIRIINDNICFGHTRLSIIDLQESSNQPFVIDDSYFLTYNGEVYNYKELRLELESNGHIFRTNSDTEVVLRSYMEWGEGCVKKFNGMWAFAIYDLNKNVIFCSRDRFGIKPFVYYVDENIFFFSSECKPIFNYFPNLKKPNFRAIDQYFDKGIAGQLEETWFLNILRLMPAHSLVYSIETGKTKISKYWDYPKHKSQLSFEDSKEEFKKIFLDSVKLRTRTDVSYSSTLTAGLDSSSIVGALNYLNDDLITTYTVFSRSEAYGDDDKLIFNSDSVDLNEKKVVDEIESSFNISAKFIELNFDNYVATLKGIITSIESGNSSPAIVCAQSMYKEVKKDFKVLFEGQGADELCGGYVLTLVPFYISGLVRSLNFKKLFKVLKEYRKFYSFKQLIMSYINQQDFKIVRVLKRNMFGLNIINRSLVKKSKPLGNSCVKNFCFDANQLLKQQHSYGLVNLLQYGDALSMANSIETRFPFLDYRLVEFVSSIKSDFKFRGITGKFLQRESLKDFIPDSIYNSKIKIGFSTPLESLFKNSKEIDNIFVKDDVFGFFEKGKPYELLNRYRNDSFSYPSVLFKILCIKLWFNIFFED